MRKMSVGRNADTQSDRNQTALNFTGPARAFLAQDRILLDRTRVEDIGAPTFADLLGGPMGAMSSIRMVGRAIERPTGRTEFDRHGLVETCKLHGKAIFHAMTFGSLVPEFEAPPLHLLFLGPVQSRGPAIRRVVAPCLDEPETQSRPQPAKPGRPIRVAAKEFLPQSLLIVARLGTTQNSDPRIVDPNECQTLLVNTLEFDCTGAMTLGLCTKGEYAVRHAVDEDGAPVKLLQTTIQETRIELSSAGVTVAAWFDHNVCDDSSNMLIPTVAMAPESGSMGPLVSRICGGVDPIIFVLGAIDRFRQMIIGAER